MTAEPRALYATHDLGYTSGPTMIGQGARVVVVRADVPYCMMVDHGHERTGVGAIVHPEGSPDRVMFVDAAFLVTTPIDPD